MEVEVPSFELELSLTARYLRSLLVFRDEAEVRAADRIGEGHRCTSWRIDEATAGDEATAWIEDRE